MMFSETVDLDNIWLQQPLSKRATDVPAVIWWAPLVPCARSFSRERVR
jgi:hypothetical protein